MLCLHQPCAWQRLRNARALDRKAPKAACLPAARAHDDAGDRRRGHAPIRRKPIGSTASAEAHWNPPAGSLPKPRKPIAEIVLVIEQRGWHRADRLTELQVTGQSHRPLRGRHSVARRRLGLFIYANTRDTMRTMAHPRKSYEHVSTNKAASSGQRRAPKLIRSTLRPSVLRRLRTRSTRHLSCSASVALHCTQRSNGVTSSASSSARRRCFTLPTLPRF
jgi:hypothetical protein